MTLEVRSQGRPARGEGEVGRLRLLERTREALRVKPKVDIQRREIAMFAGVTPALVSYYYPDKWDLFAAAAKPVIQAYTDEVRTVLHAKSDTQAKVLSLATLFVRFNHQHGHLLDFYLENSDRMARKGDLDALHEVYGEMLVFFKRLLGEGLIRGDSPAFIQSSLWALCKYVAQQPHLAPLADSPEKDSFWKEQARKVCDLFLNGAATPHLFQAADRSGEFTLECQPA